jgi:hypothetical protein
MQYFRVFFKAKNRIGNRVYRCVWVYAEDEEDAKKKALIEGEIVDKKESEGIAGDEDIDWELDYVIDSPCMD